jgi:hypothetical protein
VDTSQVVNQYYSAKSTPILRKACRIKELRFLGRECTSRRSLRPDSGPAGSGVQLRWPERAIQPRRGAGNPRALRPARGHDPPSRRPARTRPPLRGGWHQGGSPPRLTADGHVRRGPGRDCRPVPGPSRLGRPCPIGGLPRRGAVPRLILADAGPPEMGRECVNLGWALRVQAGDRAAAGSSHHRTR